jgi:hypothetical protein
VVPGSEWMTTGVEPEWGQTPIFLMKATDSSKQYPLCKQKLLEIKELSAYIFLQKYGGNNYDVC